MHRNSRQTRYYEVIDVMLRSLVSRPDASKVFIWSLYMNWPLFNVT